MAKSRPPKTQVGDSQSHSQAALPAMTDAEIKAWVRREIAMASTGHSEDERKELNP